MAAKRILVLSDGTQLPESALNHIFQFFSPATTRIVGLFVQDLSYLDMLSVMGSDEMAREFNFTFVEEGLRAGEEKIKSLISPFEDRCRKEGFSYEIHFEKGTPANEIVNESRFCDLIITGYQAFFANIDPIAGKGFLKDVLQDAHCPILVVPEKTGKIRSIVMGYDASVSAALAIRQFCQLMPENLLSLPVSILSVQKREGEVLPQSEEEGIQRLVAAHCANADLTYRHGEAGDEIKAFVHAKESPILIMGSYGRSLFSMLFHHSTSDSILRSGQVPVFITHA